MALFTKTTQKKRKKAQPRAEKQALSAKESAIANAVLRRPRITEKAYALSEKNQYVFQVAPDATKKSVKQSVEEAYGVAVEKVRIVRLPGKTKMSGRTGQLGKRSGVKKAIVTTRSGQTIELFKGGL